MLKETEKQKLRQKLVEYEGAAPYLIFRFQRLRHRWCGTPR